MSKTTRILKLYQQLMHGEVIDRNRLIWEFGINSRTFDRDIQDIRNFLSENYTGLDIVYDSKLEGYRIANLQIKREMGVGECFLLSKLILGFCELRADERVEKKKILLSQLPIDKRERVSALLQHLQTDNIYFEKATLKLVEDLLYSIEKAEQIELHFFSDNNKITCVPYTLEIDKNQCFLVAYLISDLTPVLFYINQIESYTPLRSNGYIFWKEEKKQLDQVSSWIFAGQSDKYQKYIARKEG